MKKKLGLDLGTNSIGWALVEQDFDNKQGSILGIGSRIIPMDAAQMGNFDAGNSISQTAERTGFRGVRRLRERHLLRRERLHRVLNILGFLPEHYAKQIDFKKHFGQFVEESEPKLAWVKNENYKYEFLFQSSFNEMVADFKANGQSIKIPYDWTIYYLRKRALSHKITKEELAWLILNFNQKRGYYQLRGEEEENPNKLVKFHSLKVIDVVADVPYLLTLENGMEYRYETSENLLEWKDYEREFIVTTYLNPDGTTKKDENGRDKCSLYMLKDNDSFSFKKSKNTSIEKCRLKIVDVKENNEQKKDEVWYSLTLENGWIYRRSSKTPMFDWKDKVRDFIVTTDKKDKEGNEKRSFRAPNEEDWTLLKTKTENDLGKHIREYKTRHNVDYDGTVGTFIYEILLQNPTQKIRGQLVRTIERKFYKTELEQILKKQTELQPELFTEENYNRCVRELYKNNAEHQNELNGKNFVDLFIKDIIFYQRPLRSQKSNIGNCALEFREHKINKLDENGKPIKNVFEKDENGKDIIVKEYLKGAPKSNPYYQEFRIWQWLYNLKIYTREDDRDVTKDFIKDTIDRENLFEFLMSKKEVNNKTLILYLLSKQGKKKKEADKEITKYRWNYVFDNTKEKEEDKSKKYPCNETGYEIRSRLKKVENVSDVFLKQIDEKTKESNEYLLWHIIYSVQDLVEFKKALISFAINKIFNNDTKLKDIKKQIIEFVSEHKPENNKEHYQIELKKFVGNFDSNTKEKICTIISFVENFNNFKPFKSEYGSFSEKAIKKLLPLIRLGKYWNENEIPESVKEQANSIEERLEAIHSEICSRLQKIEKVPYNFLMQIDEKTQETNEYLLWHIIYSVTDKIEFEKELSNFAKKNNLDEISFVNNFKNFKIDSFVDDVVSKQILKSFFNKTDFIQGLQLYQASYLVYGRHSEAEVADNWKTVADLEQYLDDFKQHSLRNPIVEQIITETLRVVRDIWKHYGQSAENFFDEIHIELGREMKNTAEDRAKIAKQVSENENTNLRIKAMLMEFANDDSFKNQTDYSNYCKEGENLFFYKQGNNPVRPYSQTQHDILKIYEEYVLNDHTEQDLKNEKTGLTETKDGKSKELTIYDISQKSQPTKTQIEKYKLWLEQQYRSPYTGQMISLTKLFTPAYEIEHIIPKSRYFDDSFNNKVICEATVNKLKDKQLGLEFIRNNHGQIVDTGFGGTVKIFEEEAYQTFVKKHYAKNNAKRRNLLLDEIPDKMIERQLNDTRYISKFISNLLSNIVRAETNDYGVNSINLIPVTGKITSKLKQDWGLNDIWNDLILPRFQRMNKLTESDSFTSKNKNGKDIPDIPLELSKGFQKKRIDHRHHAMDALVIACATRDHVNLLNNQHAKSENSRYDLQHKLRNIEKWTDKDGKERYKFTEFKKPYNNFTVDAKNALEKIIVSFKQNLRVIKKATNNYEKYQDGKKTEIKQEGVNWAIRKPLHKDTVFAKVYLLDETKEMTLKKALEKVKQTRDINIIVDKKLREIVKTLFKIYNDEEIQSSLKNERLKNISKVKVFEQKAATRFLNDLVSVFNGVSAADKAKETIKKITDTGIQKILFAHLSAKENNPTLAFSPEGIEEMNKNIVQLNDNKPHQPVYKVRIYEPIGNKFQVGYVGNKKDKYVEAAKSTNLFFAVYVDENGNRTFETIPLNVVIERLKQGLPEVPEHNDKGHLLLFHLSPNDLVYVPKKEEVESTHIKMIANLNRIYKIVSFTGNRLYAVPYYAAKSLVDKVEYTQLNKVESDIEDNLSIKHVCIKLKIDRLGGIL